MQDSTIQRPSLNGNSEQQEPVCIARIRLDERTQTRAEMRQDVIEDYAEVLTDGRELPPVVLFTEDGEEFVIGDGFHRVAAYVRAGRFEIPANVITGDVRAALLHAAGANHQHGLRRTADDKRRAVRMLLTDAEWERASNAWIAEMCHVSDHTVAAVRTELEKRQNSRRCVRFANANLKQ